MNVVYHVSAAAIAMLLSAMALAAQTQPATVAVALKVTITGVEGIVQYRTADDQPWQRAAVGAVVDQGVEFRTGPRSAVRLAIGDTQTLTLDRLGTVKLIDALNDGGKIKTDVGMKYGRVRYDIEAAGQEHDATIHSPGSTLAVRGTKVSLFNQGFYPPHAISLTGRARFRDPSGHTSSFGGPGRHTDVQGGSGGPGQTALDRTYVDPTNSSAHTNQEQQAIISAPVIAGFSFGQTLSSGGSIRSSPISPPPISNVGTGSLVFQLTWTGTSLEAPLPDLDLFVLSPKGELLGPKNGNRAVLSGGFFHGDNQGGAARTATEVAAWPRFFPLGTYQYSVSHFSGPPGQFVLAVLRDGVLLAEPATGILDSTSKTRTFQVNVPGQPPQANPPAASTPRTPARPIKVAPASRR